MSGAAEVLILLNTPRYKTFTRCTDVGVQLQSPPTSDVTAAVANTNRGTPLEHNHRYERPYMPINHTINLKIVNKRITVHSIGKKRAPQALEHM